MTPQVLLNGFANGLFLTFVAGIPCYGWLRKVKVYETFVDGAKDGFQIALKIMPYLIAMLVAIGMFRASGAMDSIARLLAPALHWLGMPADVLPLALIRPFSGSAANGILAEIIHTHGGNAYVSHLAATMMGSTETTFYVLAVYFGSVQVYRTRHAVPAGLIADISGIIAALIVCHWLLAGQYH